MTLPPTVSQAAYDYAMRGASIQAQRFHKFNRLAQIDLDDLNVAAELAVWCATRTYDPERGASFSTYAWNTVRQHLLKERDRWRYGTVRRFNDILAGLVDADPIDLRPLSLDQMGSHEIEKAAPDNPERVVVTAALLECLTPTQARVVRLRIWEGLSFRDIAKLEGVKYQSAQNAFEKAKKRMRTMLEAANG